MIEKIVVFAPIPSVSDNTATAVTTRRGAQRPSGETEIAAETVEQANAKRVAILVLDLIDTAEVEPRAAHRLGALESRVLVGLDLPIDMEPELLFHLALDGVAIEEGTQPEEEIGQHAAPIPSASTRAYQLSCRSAR